jgi:hypothetical protein
MEPTLSLRVRHDLFLWWDLYICHYLFTYKLIFVALHLSSDPENALYDDLDLNSGISTLMKPATAFSFRDRLFKPDGLKDLGVVLKKWNKGMSNCLSNHI